MTARDLVGLQERLRQKAEKRKPGGKGIGSQTPGGKPMSPLRAYATRGKPKQEPRG